jgi:hypothetical protein
MGPDVKGPVGTNGGATVLTAPAWALYRTSLLYLALLFGAMAVDGFLPGLEREPSEMVILRTPERVAPAFLPVPVSDRLAP